MPISEVTKELFLLSGQRGTDPTLLEKVGFVQTFRD